MTYSIDTSTDYTPLQLLLSNAITTTRSLYEMAGRADGHTAAPCKRHTRLIWYVPKSNYTNDHQPAQHYNGNDGQRRVTQGFEVEYGILTCNPGVSVDIVKVDGDEKNAL